jgi:hypothetical protein
MQHAMHKTPNKFGWPACPKPARVREDIIEANEKFAVKARIQRALRVFSVIERDYVGGAFMVEELLIDAGHFRRRDEMNTEFEFGDPDEFRQQSVSDAPKKPRVNAADALTVAQQQLAHFAAPRCSS